MFTLLIILAYITLRENPLCYSYSECLFLFSEKKKYLICNCWVNWCQILSFYIHALLKSSYQFIFLGRSWEQFSRPPPSPVSIATSTTMSFSTSYTYSFICNSVDILFTNYLYSLVNYFENNSWIFSHQVENLPFCIFVSLCYSSSVLCVVDLFSKFPGFFNIIPHDWM